MLGRLVIESEAVFLLEPVLRRWLCKGRVDASPCSLNAATMAAWAVEEAAELTLFLRLTRWEGLVAAREME